MTTVTLNGRPTELPRGATVDAALARSGVSQDRRGIAVAVDGEVVPRGQWSNQQLREGQEVEVLHAVQGG